MTNHPNRSKRPHQMSSIWETASKRRVTLALGYLREALGAIEEATNSDAKLDAYKRIVRAIDALEGREPTP